MQKLNKSHQATREGDSRLDARIASYELAARLQLSAPEVLDISKESAATRKLYGLDDKITEDFGRNCLLARRLLERGVRFVQVWSGADNGFPRRNWDSHEHLERDHWDMGTSMDRPAAALREALAHQPRESSGLRHRQLAGFRPGAAGHVADRTRAGFGEARGCEPVEERVIVNTVRSVLASEYPRGKLRVIIIDDGSTDATVPITKQTFAREIAAGEVTASTV